jgi:hypothetical protein
MTTDDLPFLLLLLVAAWACDRLWPAQRGRGWNNSRAATQRDVAEVLRGRSNRNQPDTTGLLIFGLAAFAIFAWLYGH